MLHGARRLVATAVVATLSAAPAMLAIVFRLAGASEFSRTQYVQYDSAIVRHFAAFRDHEAVTLARDLHDRRGVSFSTVMNLAISLTPPPALEPRVTYDSLLGSRVPGAEIQRFVETLTREISHSFANPVGNTHRAELERSATHVHAAFAGQMAARA